MSEGVQYIIPRRHFELKTLLTEHVTNPITINHISLRSAGVRILDDMRANPSPSRSRRRRPLQSLPFSFVARFIYIRGSSALIPSRQHPPLLGAHSFFIAVHCVLSHSPRLSTRTLLSMSASRIDANDSYSENRHRRLAAQRLVKESYSGIRGRLPQSSIGLFAIACSAAVRSSERRTHAGGWVQTRRQAMRH